MRPSETSVSQFPKRMHVQIEPQRLYGFFESQIYYMPSYREIRVVEYQSKLIDNVYKMKQIFPTEEAEKLSAENMAIIRKIAEHTSYIKEHVDTMVEARKVANKIVDERAKAIEYHDKITPMLEQIRYHIDKLELIVDDQMWTLPKYRELLFIR